MIELCNIFNIRHRITAGNSTYPCLFSTAHTSGIYYKNLITAIYMFMFICKSKNAGQKQHQNQQGNASYEAGGLFH